MKIGAASAAGANTPRTQSTSGAGESPQSRQIDSINKQIDSLEKDRQDVKKQMQELRKEYAAGGMDLQTYEAKNKELQDRQTQIEEQIRQLQELRAQLMQDNSGKNTNTNKNRVSDGDTYEHDKTAELEKTETGIYTFIVDKDGNVEMVRDEDASRRRAEKIKAGEELESYS